MSEIWKTHPELVDHEISNQGNCRQRNGRVLKGTFTPKGYRQFRLTNCWGSAKLYWAHRLVLETFDGPMPTQHHQVGHINGKPADNRLENLRWVTPSENQADRVLHGTSNRGERNPMYKHGGYARLGRLE